MRLGETSESDLSSAGCTPHTLRVPRLVYLINATLLICHEIDSAYWKEWELFHIPGGAVVFVALHVPLIAIVLWGLVEITAGRQTWRWYSLFLGAAGTCGGVLHGAFLISGNAAFSTWFSASLIAAFLSASLVQLMVTRAWWAVAGEDQESSGNGRK